MFFNKSLLENFYNYLKKSGYNKILELSKITLYKLQNIKNLGKKSIAEIIKKLESHNIILSIGDKNNV